MRPWSGLRTPSRALKGIVAGYVLDCMLLAKKTLKKNGKNTGDVPTDPRIHAPRDNNAFNIPVALLNGLKYGQKQLRAFSGNSQRLVIVVQVEASNIALSVPRSVCPRA